MYTFLKEKQYIFWYDIHNFVVLPLFIDNSPDLSHNILISLATIWANICIMMIEKIVNFTHQLICSLTSVFISLDIMVLFA